MATIRRGYSIIKRPWMIRRALERLDVAVQIYTNDLSAAFCCGPSNNALPVGCPNQVDEVRTILDGKGPRLAALKLNEPYLEPSLEKGH